MDASTDLRKMRRKARGRGLLAGESRRWRLISAFIIALTMVMLNFTQLGFLTISLPGSQNSFIIGLLVPLCAAGLLLGPRYGFLLGVFAGGTLTLHSAIQPLDYYELVLVGPVTSIALFGISGLLSGVIYALALRNNPCGLRRIWYLLIASVAFSIVFGTGFACVSLVQAFIYLVNTAMKDGPILFGGSESAMGDESMRAFMRMGTVLGQFRYDVILSFGAVLICDAVVRVMKKREASRSLSDTFQIGLFAVVYVAFALIVTISFMVITEQEKNDAYNRMDAQIEFVRGQLEANKRRDAALANFVDHVQVDEYVGLDEDFDAIVSDDDPMSGFSTDRDGIIVVYAESSRVIIATNDDAFAKGEKISDNMSLLDAESLKESADSEPNAMVRIILDDVNLQNDDSLTRYVWEGNVELAYARAKRVTYRGFDCIVCSIMPTELVFANRSTVLVWNTLTILVLLLAVYLVAQLFIKRFVLLPIDHTNEALARITDGDLDIKVETNESPEFTSLSNGINGTVDALKSLISEAEHRNEVDLATAKAIQRSALPRTFPPFPEIDAFDLYASMDAAKEVGGDFYDFFIVDDNTLVFLIADVSGKGIPGALFMMAAKAEIENYLSTGMGPAEAILSVNRRLCATNDAGMFVTVWVATLNWETGELTYVNAGHNFPLVRRGEGGTWEWLKKRCGLFLGTFETAKYKEEKITLYPGDEVLLYTDGVNEAFNVNEEEYGNERLEAFLNGHADLHPKDLVKSLRADVAAWADGAEQSDDVTILALE
ncbi:MAG: SpoIIE family protein phosphatase, partial [Atopobiaceae bacterium]|nr:SpoIIE family protein phosphatase [Atopobiaceae bacterium]